MDYYDKAERSAYNKTYYRQEKARTKHHDILFMNNPRAIRRAKKKIAEQESMKPRSQDALQD